MSPPASTRLGTILVFISALSFGTLGVFSRHLRDAGFTVPMMLSWRFIGGAVVMWLLTLARREFVRLASAQVLGFAVLGVLYVAEAWTYFESANRIPVALTALLLYLYPAVVAVLSWVLFKETLGGPGFIALTLALAGVALAVGNPSGGLQPLGIILGIATSVMYSAYVLVGARVQAGVPSTLGSAIVMTTAALAFAVIATVSTGWHLSSFDAATLANVTGLIVFGTAIPIPLLLIGLARIGPTRASIVSSVEPISAAICGLAFLGEALTAWQWVGASCVLAAVLLLSTRAN